MKINCTFGLTFLFFIVVYQASAQENKSFKDSLANGELDEVVVTATRNERKLSNVAVPATVISEKTILRAGSLRLKDILNEQTGLFLTNGFGSGVQMQGLNPDYTLILIDGEPLIGRTAGVLDVNRITVGNIRKVEIIKGPSSSLYGSEAMAGVINIITDRSFNRKLNVGLRYGSLNTFDVNASASDRFKKIGVNIFLNAYRSDGYTVRPLSIQMSKLPVHKFTPQLQLNYPIGLRTNLTLSTRFNYEFIKNELAVANNGSVTYSKGKEINKDINIIPAINHEFSKKVKTSVRLYGSIFEGSQKLTVTDGQGYNDFFRQQFYKIENQTDYIIITKLSLVAGTGYIREFATSTRYDNKNSRKENTVIYGLMQTEWKPVNAVTIIAGIRYDHNKLYASAISPKIAMQLKFGDGFRLKASFGKGFKAPDFRQLYLNFTNTAAGSYSVFGALEAQRVIQLLNEQHLIREFHSDYYRLQQLKPEFSNGWNAGFTANPFRHVQWDINFFRNDINDLIESRQVATRFDNSQIFSYINIKRAYTTGVETNFDVKINKFFSASAGYQFLLSGDKDELDKLREGNYYYTRDQNNFSWPLKKSDYAGLPNRSRHMGNLKFTFDHSEKKLFAYARAIYRGKWVVYDKDGNGIYNKQDEYADGFILINLSVGKSLRSGLRIQAGVDNLFDYTDVMNLSNMPGRILYGSIAYTFLKK